MDNKAYLEQISRETRPVKTKNGPFGLDISPRLFKILIGAFIAAILIIIIGLIANSGGSSEQKLVTQVYLRSTNLMSALSDYNKQVKSSELRSMGTSLNSVLTETTYSLSSILEEDFGITSPDRPGDDGLVESETEYLAVLNQDLETSRLNGQLDRVFARDFAYEIAMLMSLESETSAKSEKNNLKSALAISYSNLEKLYDQFNNFSAK